MGDIEEDIELGSNQKDAVQHQAKAHVTSSPVIDTMNLRGTLTRRKRFSTVDLETTPLNRCLNTWDLTALGLGGTLGAGVHVLVGAVAVNVAGPAVVLSFAVAALAAVFAALCFSELSARIPKAGSSYIYTYVVVGEAAGFITGWIVMFELMFGTASVARGLSLHIDGLYDNNISEWCKGNVPISLPWLGGYFDVLAFTIVLLVGALAGIGVRQSSTLINMFTIINMVIIIFIIIAGSLTAKSSNWTLPENLVPAGFGTGGFFPYGPWGVIKGAAICFYGFVGFDAITYTGEEVIEPRRSIPRSILIVTCVSTGAYCGVAAVITMMVPYYLQEPSATVAAVFSQVGWDWAKWIIAVGGVFGITASLIGGVYSMSRLIYSKASDRLLCSSLSRVTTGRKSPLLATAVTVVIIALLSSILELSQLITTLCVGTLLSYSAVALCVMILRYESQSLPYHDAGWLGQAFGFGYRQKPTTLSCRIAYLSTFFFVCTSLTLALIGLYLDMPLVPLIILHCVLVLFMFIIFVQPVTRDDSVFQTPLVPVVPLLSIYINIHLMVHISSHTWIRIAIWILIGIPVYLLFLFCYKKYTTKKEFEERTRFDENDLHIIPNVQIISEPPKHVAEIKTISTNRAIMTEEILTQQATIDYGGDEKEAKVIDLLDQVIKAEEDAYVEIDADHNAPYYDVVEESEEDYRKSSQLSNACSETSLSAKLSKYDVVAQVHREDIPKITRRASITESARQYEQYEMTDITVNNTRYYEDNKEIKHEHAISFHGSETNSRTDESGYSDTIDINNVSDLLEDKEIVPRIPSPPPMDELYFSRPRPFTISAKSTNNPILSEKAKVKRRLSIQSNGSHDDNNIVFGSVRQLDFMTKLNDMLQIKLTNNATLDQNRHSTGNLIKELDIHRERSPEFSALMKEIVLKDRTSLKFVKTDDDMESNIGRRGSIKGRTLTRKDLKSKLETIFATGGPKPFKPTGSSTSDLDVSNDCFIHQAPEEEPKVPRRKKYEKNDTLKRQKTKFNEVVDSIKKNFHSKGENVEDNEL